MSASLLHSSGAPAPPYTGPYIGFPDRLLIFHAQDGNSERVGAETQWSDAMHRTRVHSPKYSNQVSDGG